MMQPNWFDTEHETDLKSATAREALKLIAADSVVLAAVEDALAQHDANMDKLSYVGPSRTQVIRSAVSDALMKTS